MNDLSHVGTLFLIFALALMGYGAALAATGNKELLPLHAQHSVSNKDEVRRVGRIVVVVGLVIGAMALLLRIVAGS